ncbi:hypothetical protein AB6N24_09980 [Cellulomonas sp. 179-A 4D5 NHS]|uniref:hypothetical protein n=1 Tax=Cellulomonas sp. 179-A 4D5 NHS TaxID=3142378 RepID=UPI0039A30724
MHDDERDEPGPGRASRSTAPAQEERLVDRRFLLGAAMLVVLGAVGGTRLAAQITRASEERDQAPRSGGGATNGP